MRIELLTRQPTMQRANTSMTKATYSQPCQVETYVKLLTHNWFGRSGPELPVDPVQRARCLGIPVGGANVVSHTGLARPTVHRILRVVVEEGAVEQDPGTRRYLIGGEVSLLGLARSARFPIRAIAEPHLRHLSEVLGDMAFLTIRNGTDSICIDRRLGSFPVKVLSIEVGARRPLGVGVSGLVPPAALPPEEAEQVVRQNECRLRELQIDAEDLLIRARHASAVGFAYAQVGVVPRSRAVAVPVILADGRTVAGLAIATITEQLPDARCPSRSGRLPNE